ncbi:P-selectin-like [Ruditapes philippinarum]|uniref:P-selectin-like n=1 Tax=Ruditapes philippinarum TaxID=129788 RepID=UPI00295AB940|nr:P-selectin-like [Ruditapes philippinarum]
MENGIVNPKTIVSANSTANFSCYSGYKLTGESMLTCLPNGTWNLNPPTCIVKNCTSLTLEKGIVNSKMKVSTNSTANFSCFSGYSLKGESVLTCLPNETWNLNPPTCIVNNCKALSLGNGVVNPKTIVSANSSANFSCYSGYSLTGESMLTCLPNGTWNVNPPTCIVNNCKALTMENGIVNPKTIVSANSTANFSCYSGYKLTGESMLTCLPNGTWNLNPPTCIVNNCTSLTLVNGEVNPKTIVSANSTATFSCYSGYSLTGESMLTCLPNGTWNVNPPTCIVRNCTSLTLVNGEVNPKTIVSANSSANFSCYSGYSLTGESMLTCLPNGTWNLKPPRCIVRNCTSLTLENGIVKPKTLISANSTANFSCYSGYRLTGESILTCLPNGTWNLNPPTCIVNKCKSLLLRNGEVNPKTKVSANSTANFSCYSGYKLIGEPILTCLPNGTWNLKPPTCVVKNCTSLTLVNGEVNPKTIVSANSSANFSCYSGYSLTGESMLTCLPNGTWNVNPPTCIVNNCTSLTLKNGIVNPKTIVSANSTANFSCNSGYELTGESILTCLPNGTWNFRSPRCKLKNVVGDLEEEDDDDDDVHDDDDEIRQKQNIDVL